MPPVKKPASDTVELVELKTSSVVVRVEGTSPLIVNRFSEKAKEMMLQAQMQTTRVKKDAKDPHALYEASRYRLPDGRDGMPAAAFKAAMVGAARDFDGITMTSLKTAIFVEGEGAEQLVPILGTPEMREDAVRNASGVADLRYRAMYHPWAVDLTIEFLPQRVSESSLLALLNAAGRGGVGEWRPSAPKSSTGSYGRFKVADGTATVR